MPLQGSAGYSSYTPVKQEQFRYIVRTHLRIVQAIQAKHRAYTHQEYFYFDLNAGAGMDGTGRAGSPLIFLEEATHLAMPFRAYFFERDPETAALLRESIGQLAERMGMLSGAWKLSEGDHSDTIESATHEIRSLDLLGYGLAYGDPNGADPPVAPMQTLTHIRALKCLDYLIHVGATSYKRARNGRRLSTDLRAVGKRHILLREPQDRWQWTFGLLTDWDQHPDFRKMRFHRAESVIGQEIERRMDLTREEYEEALRMPLPFPSEMEEEIPNGDWPGNSTGVQHRLTEPTPNTSAIRDSSPFGPLFSGGPVGAANDAEGDRQPSRIT